MDFPRTTSAAMRWGAGGVSFAPLGLDSFSTRDPQLALWALFLRRFAANPAFETLSRLPENVATSLL